jgi:hypothetical protein
LRLLLTPDGTIRIQEIDRATGQPTSFPVKVNENFDEGQPETTFADNSGQVSLIATAPKQVLVDLAGDVRLLGAASGGTGDILIGEATNPDTVIAGSGNDTIFSSLNAFLGLPGSTSDTLTTPPARETIIGGDGKDTVYAYLANGTNIVTIEGGNGDSQYFYKVPIINDPQKQGFVQLFTGNGNDIVGGAGPAEIDLGKGNDFVLPGFGSIVNADGDPNRGQDVIFTANDVQLNNLQPQDRINLLGITNLTGGLQWVGSESPFAYGTFAKYGLNQDGELVITTYLGRDGQTMFVSKYHGGPGVPISQETAGIFIAQADIGASLLLKAPPGWGPAVPSLMKALLKASLGPDILTKIGIDPLVFDLTGDGINLQDLSSVSPRFDMNGNGFSVQTGWIGPGNGLLVLDKNGDGQINNVNELFGGDATSGGPTAIGFAQLAKYDSNLDGVIDANDPIYSQLRVWVDSNGNGVVDPGELVTLQQAGITSINLTPTLQSGDMNAGNQIMATGSFTRADGSAGSVADVSFQIDTRDTTFTGDTSIGAAAAALPNLKGYGTLTDLQVAMTHDPALANPTLGPSLMSVVQNTLPTLTSLDLPTLRADITPILTTWANAVQGVDPNGNPLTITTQTHADVPILVSTDGTGAETVIDFAYEVIDSLGSYWKLASGTQITDSQGNTIQRPTLAQITSEPPSGSSWTSFSGAQLDFMERYTGESIPLGTGAPLNPGAALSDATQLISTMPILVSTDSTGAMTVVDFAYEITDAQGSYWAFASGDTVTDADGNTIARPTLAQVEAQPPAGEGWTTFSGAQLDFMERYTGDQLPLGTGAPLDAGAALQAGISTIQTLWQTLNQLAVALTVQGPLASYFQGIIYDVSTNEVLQFSAPWGVGSLNLKTFNGRARHRSCIGPSRLLKKSVYTTIET